MGQGIPLAVIFQHLSTANRRHYGSCDELATDPDMTVSRRTWSVLMVDDNPAMREAIARSLARRGCAVTTAGDAAEALASLRRQSGDVGITDLNMPERGGLWLWRQAVMVRAELRGRFVVIASEPLPRSE